MRRRTRFPGSCALRGRRLVLAAGVFFLLLPEAVFADRINGAVDWTYSNLDIASRDAAGTASNQEVRSFIQLYNLNMDKDIFPMLKLSAGGTFQKNSSDIILSDARNSSTTMLTRPSIDLRLNNPVLSMGAGFNRAATESIASGVRGPTLLSDSYRGYLGWKPSELPTVDLSLTRSNSYDRDRASRDVATDQAALSSRFEPLKGLQLQYQGSAIGTRDRIRDLETKIIANSGRISYMDRFLKDRISFSSQYDVGRSTTQTIARGAATGTVPFQVFAFDGLYAGSNIPNNVQLASTPFLIDNDVSGTNNNAVNIGSSPFTSPPPQDTSLRNIGLRFGVAAEINTLHVWVNSGTNYLTPAVAGSFTWGIYTSQDNQNWSLHQQLTSAPFEINAALPGVGRFELACPAMQAQYIKVVVNPLLPAGEGVLFPVIAVTELQAFASKTAAEVQGKTSGTNQSLSLYTKVTLWDAPGLFYDFSYLTFETSSGGTTVRRSTMSNGLSMLHRFNRILSGAARAERVDGSEPFPTGDTVAYNYTASLQAVPLPTLRHSLAYGVGIRETREGRTDTNSLFLSNTAELYANVSAFLNAGLSIATQETGQKSEATTYSYGLGLAPAKILTVTLSATDQDTTQTGGGLPEASLRSRRQDASAAYTPFSTLYLTAGISRVSQDTLRSTIQNYGVNWSPFPGGALQFTIAYSESLSDQDNSIVRTTQPNVRWTISRWASANASYIASESISNLGRTMTTVVAINFRALI